MPLNGFGNWTSIKGWFADDALSVERAFDPSLDEATSSSGLSFSPSAAALVLAGATALIGLGIAPSGASAALTGATPTVVISAVRAPAAATLTLSASTPSLIQGTVRAPSGATLALSPATPSQALGLPAVGATATLVGATPTLTIGSGSGIQPAGAALLLTGATPTQDLGLSPTKGALTLSAGTPAVFVGAVAIPAGGSLALAGATPSLVIGTVRAPSAGALALSGATPTVSRGGLTLSPTAAALALSGSTPTLGFQVAPSATAFVLSRGTPSLIVGTVRAPISAPLALSGATPRLDLGMRPAGATASLTPSTPVVATVASSDVIALSASATSPIALPASATVRSGYRARVIRDGAIFYARLGDASAPFLDLIHGDSGTVTGSVTPGQPGAISDGDAAIEIDNSASASYVTFPSNTALAALVGTRAFSQELWLAIDPDLIAGFDPGDLNVQYNAWVLTWQDSARGSTGGLVATYLPPDWFNVGDPARWALTAFMDALRSDLDAVPATYDLVTGESLINIVPGRLYHVVVTYNGLTASLYVNGALVSRADVTYVDPVDGHSGDVAVGAESFRIGHNIAPVFGGDLPFGGIVDEVAIYGSVLTAEQVAAHYADRLSSPVITLAASTTTPILLPGSTV